MFYGTGLYEVIEQGRKVMWLHWLHHGKFQGIAVKADQPPGLSLIEIKNESCLGLSSLSALIVTVHRLLQEITAFLSNYRHKLINHHPSLQVSLLNLISF